MIQGRASLTDSIKAMSVRQQKLPTLKITSKKANKLHQVSTNHPSNPSYPQTSRKKKARKDKKTVIR